MCVWLLKIRLGDTREFAAHWPISGHQVGRGTIANIPKENGVEPAPERDAHTRWSAFLKAHWECLTAADFLSVEVYTIKGIVTHYILFFIDIASNHG